MKKTLHGKRHLRARAPMIAARNRKRMAKFMRGYDAFLVFSKQLTTVLVDMTVAFENIGKYATQIANTIQNKAVSNG